ncbi:energy transducer TonB [Methylorubrum sp. SB2]|uniref:energy transducer TonB family protein n=1 Tax=Methylorubrum subtropicum TaxID=3138812 RepID=UPI00313C592F
MPFLIAAAFGLILALGPAEAREGRPAETPAFAAYKARIALDILGRMHRIRYRSQTGGIARVRFRIDRTGKVAASEIHTSSGNPYIDRLAMEAVPLGSELPPIPAELGIPSIGVTVPLHFPPRYY